MATLRERRPGVCEVGVVTGTDRRGRPTQLSRTGRGGKRDAMRWRPSWNQQSRVKGIKTDPIARVPVARLTGGRAR